MDIIVMKRAVKRYFLLLVKNLFVNASPHVTMHAQGSAMQSCHLHQVASGGRLGHVKTAGIASSKQG